MALEELVRIFQQDPEPAIEEVQIKIEEEIKHLHELQPKVTLDEWLERKTTAFLMRRLRLMPNLVPLCCLDLQLKVVEEMKAMGEDAHGHPRGRPFFVSLA